MPAVVGMQILGIERLAGAGPPSRSRRAHHRSPPPSPRSCPRPWPIRRRGRRPGRRPPRARTPSRRPPASAWARPRCPRIPSPWRPSPPARRRPPGPAPARRARRRPPPRPAGRDRRSPPHRCRPHAPGPAQGDFRNSSDGECADIRGILPGGQLNRRRSVTNRRRTPHQRHGPERVGGMRERPRSDCPAAADLEAAVAEEKDQRHAGNEAADVRPERDAGLSRVGAQPAQQLEQEPEPRAPSRPESGAPRKNAEGR